MFKSIMFVFLKRKSFSEPNITNKFHIMKPFYCFVIVLLSQISWAQSPFFNFDKSLRFDFYLAADAHTSAVYFLQMKKEPHWGGSTTKLIHPQYGDFCLKLIDSQLNKEIFSKGFNSLMKEWKYVEQAQNEKKLFYHAIQVPFPKKTCLLQIQMRNFDGKFETLFERVVNPNDYFISDEQVSNHPIKTLLHNGSSSNKVDLVILAEGYTADQMEKFYADAQRMIDYMFTISPFDDLKDNFNVYAIGTASYESGTDIPGENIYKKTVFDASFYTFDMQRYLTANNFKQIADAASLVPYDQIYVLVNTEMYGGGAFYNHLNLTSVDHNLSEKVFVHEFGHGFVGLADEYYDSQTAFESMYNPNIEPWEENITTLVDFQNKWKDMIVPKTPIPTPRTPKYEKSVKVGAFEGGGYVSKGIYSPAADCRMKSNIPSGFCPVCERTIRKMVDFYTK
ncbi:IgA Peptidase M64 [Capnocytophaga canimorsus]|nr:peptidase M64-like protein [Capnocytophaga canimorsus]STA71663.1 IgA Peptidase M64 [Capnocytophaga canimorsus]